MTAPVVISLESRRRRPQEAATCEACARSHNGGCYPHRLEALSRRLALVLDGTEGELLVSRETFTEAVTDARGVLDRITAECLPPEHERSTR